MKKQKNTQETKKLVSNQGIVHDVQTIDSKELSKDIEELIKKHTKGNIEQSEPIIGTKTNSKKGFYLLFIEKDEDLPKDQRVLMTTLGQSIAVSDVISCFSEIMNGLVQETKPVYNA